MLVSWAVLALGQSSVIALIVGIAILDLGVQGLHISNQSAIYALRPEARSRLTTAYMVAYFLGGAALSALDLDAVRQRRLGRGLRARRGDRAGWRSPSGRSPRPPRAAARAASSRPPAPLTDDDPDGCGGRMIARGRDPEGCDRGWAA